MEPTVLAWLIVLVLAVVGAGLSWRTVTSYVCIAIAFIALVALFPGGPF